MKKALTLALICFVAAIVRGQVVPTTTTAPPSVNNVNTIPAAYNASMKVNFIRTWEATRPYTDPSDVVSGSRTLQEVKQTTHYFDGLGRSLQIVNKQTSPSGKDMVTPVIYDAFGREVFRYLPYISIDSNNGNGTFRRNPFNEQASFFTNSTYNPTFAGEQVFYKKTVFDRSPLNEIDTAFAQGNSWGGSHIGNTSVTDINLAGDSVRLWGINAAIGSTPVSNGYYSSAQLIKTTSKDEDGKALIQYVDNQGRLVLKKSQAVSSPSAHHTGWLCTYFVYDDLNNLRYIIQPKAVELRSANWQLSGTVLYELCYRYEYDSRGRVIVKKLPGAGEIWFVYDRLDRVVMMQDSLLRVTEKWSYNKYDNLNRCILRGLWTHDSSRNYHQGLAENSISYPSPGSNHEILVETYYDNYQWIGSSGSGLSSTFIGSDTSNTDYFYTPGNTTFPYPQGMRPNYIVNGLVTGSKIKVLGTSTYLYSVPFYDNENQVIQVHCTNYTGGKDTLTMQYSFSGELLRTLLRHGKAGNNAQSHRISTKYDFDDAGRLTKTIKKIDDSPETILTELVYDEFSQVKKSRVGKLRNTGSENTYSSDALDSLAYSYNIRGWLSGINKAYARGTNNNSWFGIDLSYDYGFNQPQLNGNIAGVRWRSKGDNAQRTYGFTYDVANRLTKADFTQYTGSAWNVSDGIDFSVKDISYDANGSITTMTQKGLKLTGSSVIDSLVYGHHTASNRLQYVTDKTNDINSLLSDFKESINNTSQDYWYDGNGNVTKDNNKGISSIQYNHLNLPDEIHVLSKGRIIYTYDAIGNKLRRITTDSTASPVKSDTSLYQNAFVYQNNKLQFVETEEGRARPTRYGNTDTMFYDYFEKDHLGSVRVILTDELKTDMYPEATLEDATLLDESDFYSRLDSGRVQVRSLTVYPSVPDEYKQRLIGTGPKIGAGIVLKVMAGDKFNVKVNSFYEAAVGYGLPVNPLDDLVGVITNSVGAITQSHNGPTITDLENSGLIGPAIDDFLDTQGSYIDTRPKAFVNWVLLNEQFKYVADGSGFEQVYEAGAYSGFSGYLELPHVINDLPVTKSGYLYVYVSNESQDVPVYFDNLQVTHIRGPLLEESHYYPYGLTQAGISHKALVFGGPANRHKFNGGAELFTKDFADGSGIELYETKFRGYDPQIGSFWQTDPLGEMGANWSPYVYCFDNPILLNDPSGLFGDTTKGKVLPEVVVSPPGAKPLIKRLPATQGPVFHYPSTNTPNTNTSIVPVVAGTGVVGTLVRAAAATPQGRAITAGVAALYLTYEMIANWGGGTYDPADLLPGYTAFRDNTGKKPIDVFVEYKSVPKNFPQPKLDPKIPRPVAPPYPFHGNRDDNWNPHQVYVFKFKPGPGDPRTPVLKYGIYDVVKDPKRAEYQKKMMEALYGTSVTLELLQKANNRVEAKAYEKSHVTIHVGIWGEQPREQLNPKFYDDWF